jgi:hypothetical protein
MTVTNTTPAAAPTNVINSGQAATLMFGPGSTSQTSGVFTVDQNPVFLSAYNLASGDTITIQQVYGPGSGTEFANFAPVMGVVQLTPNLTNFRIDYPGRYRLVHTGPSALGTFTVLGAAAVMSSDSLAGLAQALAAVITNIGTVVTGTAPIVVTASGGTYNVSFASSGSGGGAVTGSLTEASGAGNILNPADANKIPVLFSDGSLHTSFLGWEPKNLGTVVSTTAVDFRTSRAQVITVNGGSLVDLDITLPIMPGFLLLNVIQGGSGNTAIQFAGAWSEPNLFNASGTIQPSVAIGASTLYLVWFDGTSSTLVFFGSSDGTVGPYNGSDVTYVGGDNVVRAVGNIPLEFGAYGQATGTNTYTAANPPIFSYSTGVVYNILFANANTGASTLAINGKAATAIQRRGVAVTAGQIPAGSTLALLFDGTNFQIMGAA